MRDVLNMTKWYAADMRAHLIGSLKGDYSCEGLYVLFNVEPRFNHKAMRARERRDAS